MDSLVFRCPGCEQPFQVLAEQAGQMVRCPSCEDTVQIPAAPAPKPQAAATKKSPPQSSGGQVQPNADAQTKANQAEEVQAFGCPKCEQPFGVYPSMFGSAMACPHCQETILVQPKAEQATQQAAKPPAIVAPSADNAKKKPAPKTKPAPKRKTPVTAKQKSEPPKPTQPSVSAADVERVESVAAVPPPSPAVVEKAVAPTDQTEQIDQPAEAPVLVFVPQPVDHLLPPKFSAVDPDFFYRRHNDGSQVLLPSEDGSLKVVNNRIVRIEHNGQIYELISSPRYDRIQKSIVNNLLAVIICGLLIAIVMTLLNG